MQLARRRRSGTPPGARRRAPCAAPPTSWPSTSAGLIASADLVGDEVRAAPRRRRSAVDLDLTRDARRTGTSSARRRTSAPRSSPGSSPSRPGARGVAARRRPRRAASRRPAEPATTACPVSRRMSAGAASSSSAAASPRALGGRLRGEPDAPPATSPSGSPRSRRRSGSSVGVALRHADRRLGGDAELRRRRPARATVSMPWPTEARAGERRATPPRSSTRHARGLERADRRSSRRTTRRRCRRRGRLARRGRRLAHTPRSRRLERGVEQPRGSRRVDDHVVAEHGLGRDGAASRRAEEVAAAQLDRVEAELAAAASSSRSRTNVAS